MAAAQIVRVGVLIEMDDYGNKAFTCLSMALSDFYSTHQHYMTRLVLTSRDPKGDVVEAAAGGTHMYT